ncbi:hypothetical protein E2542_SST21936 [Spatholobus suberectus]|nr:hypothetical protein E2542_SST21936 [Spatholobus suberectus]
MTKLLITEVEAASRVLTQTINTEKEIEVEAAHANSLKACHVRFLVFYTPPCSEILIHCGFPASEFPQNMTGDYVKTVAYLLSEERTLTTQDYI